MGPTGAMLPRLMSEKKFGETAARHKVCMASAEELLKVNAGYVLNIFRTVRTCRVHWWEREGLRSAQMGPSSHAAKFKIRKEVWRNHRTPQSVLDVRRSVTESECLVCPQHFPYRRDVPSSLVPTRRSEIGPNGPKRNHAAEFKARTEVWRNRRTPHSVHGFSPSQL